MAQIIEENKSVKYQSKLSSIDEGACVTGSVNAAGDTAMTVAGQVDSILIARGQADFGKY